MRELAHKRNDAHIPSVQAVIDLAASTGAGATAASSPRPTVAAPINLKNLMGKGGSKDAVVVVEKDAQEVRVCVWGTRLELVVRRSPCTNPSLPPFATHSSVPSPPMPVPAASDGGECQATQLLLHHRAGPRGHAENTRPSSCAAHHVRTPAVAQGSSAGRGHAAGHRKALHCG